ncbi:MAG: hypothetical protein M3Y87_14360 [Myxococcota bacterium]|nr:hypothetical protein [Myxococcota bacterium]
MMPRARPSFRRTRALLVGAALFALGCASSGVGVGRLTSPGKPEAEGNVVFRWRAGLDATNGDIGASLPDGRRFAGRFLQVTSTTVAQHLDAWSTLGAPYYGNARGGAYWEPVDASSFVTRYTGRVMAQLQGPDDEVMRCLFVLEDPVAGPQSGGLGNCELSTGERIDYARLVGD